MVSRALAILLAPCVPVAALVLPLGAAHTANALIPGSIAVVLSAFSLVSRRAGVAVSVIAGWVAMFGLIYPSTPIESVISLSWGVTMFSWMAGPFGEPPRVERIRALPATPPASVPTDTGLPLAA